MQLSIFYGHVGFLVDDFGQQTRVVCIMHEWLGAFCSITFSEDWNGVNVDGKRRVQKGYVDWIDIRLNTFCLENCELYTLRT